jgi:hypothetical protein
VAALPAAALEITVVGSHHEGQQRSLRAPAARPSLGSSIILFE